MVFMMVVNVHHPRLLMSTHNHESTTSPLISFDPAGRAPILSYNVPEPTAYSGRSYIELDIDTEWFRAKTKTGTPYHEWISESILEPAEEQLQEAEAIGEIQEEIEGVHEEVEGISQEVDSAPESRTQLDTLTAAVETMFLDGQSGPIIGATDERLTESVAAVGNATRLIKAPSASDGSVLATEEGTEADDEALQSTVYATLEPNLFATGPLSQTGSGAELANATLAQATIANGMDVKVLRSIQPSTMAREMLDGRVPVAHYTMGGRPTVKYVVAPPVIKPKLMLVERYRLSTFLGNYGAGRTVKTFSLLPGEHTTISIKTFRKTSEERQEASSILDSYTTETAEEFEQSVTAEQSHKEEHEQSFAYHAEAKAEARWGWGSASASGGVEGSSNAAREESAKNIATATSKHAAEASAKREVEVDTNYEVKEETGEETSIERQLENINLSRTLNFVFRQMNQEFVTLLHLVDVRVGFTNGGFAVRSGTGTLGGIKYREVSLPDLGELLEDIIVEEQREQVQQLIEGELSNIFDYRGEARSLIEHVELPGADTGQTYLRVNPDLRDTYQDETGNEFTVPGIILSAEKNIMRTEGIVVEALLGGGESLDDYAQKLQAEEVRKRLLENEERSTNIDRERLAQSLVTDGDTAAVNRFSQVFTRDRDDQEDLVEPEPGDEPP